MTAADPNLVVAVARCWLGTPYHDQATLRGVGCDCLGLARGVWREVVGAESFPIPPYSRDWGETGPHEVLAEGARRMMPEIAIADAVPGTLIRFRMAPRAIAKHVGILTTTDSFIARAGCDKRMATCTAKFANVANFRGFPKIPGQDAVLRYASRGDGNEGNVL